MSTFQDWRISWESFPSLGKRKRDFFQSLEKLVFLFSNAWKTQSRPFPILGKRRPREREKRFMRAQIGYSDRVIQRVISKHSLRDDSTRRDLAYWLSRTPEERVSAVEILRRQVYGNTARLQRVARIVQRAQG